MPTTVHITDQGNQTISGVKTFATGVIVSGNLQVSGTGIFNAIDLNNIDNLSLSGVDITITSGVVTLTNPLSAPNLVYNTGTQTISGVKTFANSGVFSLSGIVPLNVPNNPLSVVGSGNTYVQVNIQNRATGTTATADLVITANNGTDTSNFINLGINNSGYNDPTFSNGSGLDGYLFVNGGSLDIGTATSNTQIEFHVGGTTAARSIATVSSSGLNVVSGNLTVANTGVLLSGSTPFVMHFSHPRNNTAIGSQYYYFGPTIDIGPVSLNNNEKRRVRILQDCFLRKISWSVVARDSLPLPSNAMTGYFKNFGANALTDDQTAGVQVTSGMNILATNTIYNSSTGTLNISIRSGDYVSFYYQTNYTGAPNAASGVTVNVDGYFYV
jgi:hypothetical protein